MTVALPEIRIGDPLRHESLSVFPLFSNSVGVVDYRLSESALADESLLVEEIDEGGSVPDLLVENKGDIAAAADVIKEVKATQFIDPEYAAVASNTVARKSEQIRRGPVTETIIKGTEGVRVNAIIQRAQRTLDDLAEGKDLGAILKPREAVHKEKLVILETTHAFRRKDKVRAGHDDHPARFLADLTGVFHGGRKDKRSFSVVGTFRAAGILQVHLGVRAG